MCPQTYCFTLDEEPKFFDTLRWQEAPDLLEYACTVVLHTLAFRPRDRACVKAALTLLYRMTKPGGYSHLYVTKRPNLLEGMVRIVFQSASALQSSGNLPPFLQGMGTPLIEVPELPPQSLGEYVQCLFLALCLDDEQSGDDVVKAAQPTQMAHVLFFLASGLNAVALNAVGNFERGGGTARVAVLAAVAETASRVRQTVLSRGVLALLFGDPRALQSADTWEAALRRTDNQSLLTQLSILQVAENHAAALAAAGASAGDYGPFAEAFSKLLGAAFALVTSFDSPPLSPAQIRPFSCAVLKSFQSQLDFKKQSQNDFRQLLQTSRTQGTQDTNELKKDIERKQRIEIGWIEALAAACLEMISWSSDLNARYRLREKQRRKIDGELTELCAISNSVALLAAIPFMKALISQEIINYDSKDESKGNNFSAIFFCLSTVLNFLFRILSTSSHEPAPEILTLLADGQFSEPLDLMLLAAFKRTNTHALEAANIYRCIARALNYTGSDAQLNASAGQNYTGNESGAAAEHRPNMTGAIMSPSGQQAFQQWEPRISRAIFEVLQHVRFCIETRFGKEMSSHKLVAGASYFSALGAMEIFNLTDNSSRLLFDYLRMCLDRPGPYFQNFLTRLSQYLTQIRPEMESRVHEYCRQISAFGYHAYTEEVRRKFRDAIFVPLVLDCR